MAFWTVFILWTFTGAFLFLMGFRMEREWWDWRNLLFLAVGGPAVWMFLGLIWLVLMGFKKDWIHE